MISSCPLSFLSVSFGGSWHGGLKMLRSSAPTWDGQRCSGEQCSDASRCRAHDWHPKEGRGAAGEPTQTLTQRVCMSVQMVLEGSGEIPEWPGEWLQVWVDVRTARCIKLPLLPLRVWHFVWRRMTWSLLESFMAAWLTDRVCCTWATSLRKWMGRTSATIPLNFRRCSKIAAEGSRWKYSRATETPLLLHRWTYPTVQWHIIVNTSKLLLT